jgi:hypothetical protein
MAARHLSLLSDHHLHELATPGPAAVPSQEPSGDLGERSGDLAALRRRLVRGSDLLPSRPPVEDLFPTGLPAVDTLLSGGLVRGCLTELRGAPSSGRLSLVLSLLAAATGRGEAVALIDLGDHLDPQAAVEAGVDLQRLLWARPARLRDALAAAEIALGGAFPLVVLELGTPPLRGKRDEHGWLRLARAARHHRGALLVATPYRITGSAASEVLALSRHRGVWLGGGSAPRLLAGLDSRLHREKSRRDPEPATAAVAWQSSLAFPGIAGSPQGPPLVSAAAPREAAREVAAPARRPTRARGPRPRLLEPASPRAATAAAVSRGTVSRGIRASVAAEAAPQHAVPGWVPLARAALAESLRGESLRTAPPPRGRA